MNRPVIFLFTIAIISAAAGCQKKGCTDNAAYNFESSADKDDGTCKFSTVVFKVDENSFGYDSVINSWSSLYLDGMSIGSINRSGTRTYELLKGTSQKYLVESTVYDNVGNVYLRADSGFVVPNPNAQSIDVNLFD
jgi:hypothetical protein